MLKRILKTIGKANISRADYNSIRDKITMTNYRSLRVYTLIATVFFAIALVVALITGVDTMRPKVYAYGLGTILSAAAFAITLKTGDKNHRVILWMEILFIFNLFIFGLNLALFIAPQQLTISLIVLYMIVPQLFVGRPIRIQIPVLITDVAFIVGATLVKPADILPLEIVDCIAYSTIGLFIGYYTCRSRLKGLLFEKKVSELSGHEQLIEYLKSMGNIYVSLHYIDLSNGTFAKIKSADFIDESLKDRYENYSEQVKTVITATTQSNYLEETLEFVEYSTLQERMRGKHTLTHEFMGKHVGWCRARFIAVGDVTPNSVPRYVLFAVENIDDQKSRESNLITQAETETMTGLLNRQAGIRKIKQCLKEEKYGMLCMFDVDKFKQVNDNYGHRAGDEVIMAVANSMQKAFRGADILLRLGGDEFVVYVYGIVNEEMGSQLISRFFDILSKVKIAEIPDYSISLSLGAAFYRGEENLDFDALYHRADSCTYESKKIEGKAFTFWR
ncbi:GGDEF domain-containing protein [Fibrobacter sp. UWEL]|uniref:GGDEF domain-containing protein n=1 Tax=Fibrobacter sp. UWEL TaxID=1896209 RepID=UPI0009112003|nr:diguanylate cyclase [Fibrobacter sp. UWEL]SHK97465.1 diguanylate cyclase (GGDEF) domain-containing protein [Fibrobacter sp. UWEL]